MRRVRWVNATKSYLSGANGHATGIYGGAGHHPPTAIQITPGAGLATSTPDVVIRSKGDISLDSIKKSACTSSVTAQQ